MKGLLPAVVAAVILLSCGAGGFQKKSKMSGMMLLVMREKPSVSALFTA